MVDVLTCRLITLKYYDVYNECFINIMLCHIA